MTSFVTCLGHGNAPVGEGDRGGAVPSCGASLLLHRARPHAYLITFGLTSPAGAQLGAYASRRAQVKIPRETIIFLAFRGNCANIGFRLSTGVIPAPGSVLGAPKAVVGMPGHALTAN